MNEVIEWVDGTKKRLNDKDTQVLATLIRNYECYHRQHCGKGKHKQRMENIYGDPIRDN